MDRPEKPSLLFGVRAWVIPLVACLLLAGIGLWGQRQLSRSLETQLGNILQAVLQSEVRAINMWSEDRKAGVRARAQEGNLRESVQELVTLSEREGVGPQDLLRSQILGDLRGYLEPLCRERGFIGFVVTRPDGMNVAALLDEPVGQNLLAENSDFIARVLAGETVLTKPFRSEVALPDESGLFRSEWPTMFVAAPVRNFEGEIIAVLSFRIRPETELTRILSVARIGQSGETYIFADDGLMLSQSRFMFHLRQVGLLPDQLDTLSILNNYIRDPGGNLVEGYLPESEPNQWPLTRMAASATLGESGVDTEGYRDYRGVPVVGAWTWLPESGFGLTTEIDAAEAHAPILSVRLAFRALYGLLIVTAVVSLLLDRRERSKSLALAESEKWYRMLVETMPDGVGVMGADHKLTFVNDQLCKMTGYSAEELVGTPAAQSVLPGPDKALSDRQLERRREGEAVPYEVQGLRKDGRGFWMRISPSIIQDGGGNYAGSMGVVTDITARKKAEAAVIRERDFAESLIDTARAIILILDTEGNIVRYNEYLAEISGYSLDETRGKDWVTTFLPLAHHESIRDLFATAIGVEKTKGNINPIVTRTGELRYIEWHDTTLKDDEGAVTGLLAVGIDVSERLEAEAAGRESEERFRQIASNIREVFWVGSPDWQQIDYISPPYEDMVGRSCESLYENPLSWFESVHPDDQPQVVEDMERLPEGDFGEKMRDYRIIRSDKTVRWVSARPFPIRDEAGKVVQIVGIVEDITERKEAARKLAVANEELEDRVRLRTAEVVENQRTLSALMGNLPGMVYRSANDPAWSLEFANEACLELTGYPPSDLVAKKINFADLIHPDDVQMVWDGVQAGVDERRSYQLTYRITSRDGQLKWVWEQGCGIFDEDGEFQSLEGFVLDITDRKKAEEELAVYRHGLEDLVDERTAELTKVQEELVRKEKLATLGQLSATVSHELRNPLGTIRSSVYSLRQRMNGDDPAIRAALDRSERSIVRCDRIIEEMLDYTRVTEPNLERTHLDEWLEDVLSEQATALECALERKLESGAEVLIDRDRMRRCLINLTTNACQAMDGSGMENGEMRVLVSARQSNGRVEISVKDTGCGMTEEQRGRVFEPLYSTKSFGVGLGLPIVKQTVEGHGGGIEIDSNPGEGTTVMLWIPLKEGGIGGT